MTDLRAAAQQALAWIHCHRRAYAIDEPIEERNLRAALAQQEQADYPEEKLQAVAEYVSNQYHVWYGVAARDIEEVLRQSVRCGLVSNPPRREWQSLSEEEIDAVWEGAQVFNTHYDIARAVEQALKERNT